MSVASKTINRVRASISDFGLLDPGDRVLVGLSGGPDSIALLHILHRLQDDLDISLAAIYLNHLLRPRSAKKEADFCRSLCESLAVIFHYEEADVSAYAAENNMGIEEAAREVRYRIYDEAASRGGYTKIAVGHHRDDRAETILFNLFRGTGRQGVVGLQPKRGKIIRPLYDLYRDEIMAYLKQHRLRHMVDMSNRSRAFTRNRIRNRVLPLIKKEISASVVDNLLRYSRIVADEDMYLKRLTDKEYDKLLAVTPGGKFNLDLTDKLEYDVWLWRRLVLSLLSGVGLFEIGYDEVERIVELIRSGKKTRLALRAGFRAETAGDRLYVFRPGRKIVRKKVAIPGRYRLEYPRLCVTLERVDRRRRVGGAGGTAYVDVDRIEGELYITGMKAGMKFHPYGRPGSKKVGDFLTDRKYPRPLRDELPILCDDNGIVWVAGLEIDHRVRVQSTTREIAKIEIEAY